MNIFNELLYRPLFNLLVFLYNTLAGHDLGVAIILVTIIVKLILYSFSQSSIQSQKAMMEIQPKVKEIQEKYKNDKEKQATAIFDIYKSYKVNPFSSFLVILIQIPILIALYQVFLDGLDLNKMVGLYSFVAKPSSINHLFLGFLDLSKASPVLAILAGASSFIQSRMMMPKVEKKDKKDDFMSLWSEQMIFMMPFITTLVAWKFPAGLALYWTTITLFSIIQQYFTPTLKTQTRLLDAK